MPDSWCGKNCEACARYGPDECPGCKAGPGRENGSCEIARCCSWRGIGTCENCHLCGTCEKYARRDSRDEYTGTFVPDDPAAMAAAKARARGIAPLLSVLFWLVVPILISNILSSDVVTGNMPQLALIGSVLAFAVNIVRGVTLLLMGKYSENYRKGGAMTLIGCALTLLVILIQQAAAVLTIGVVSAAVQIYGEYCELNGHIDMTAGVAPEICAKWRSLWKLYVVAYAMVFLSPFALLLFSLIFSYALAALLGIVALLAMLAGLVILVVYSIRKLIWIYRTAAFYRGLAAE